MPALTGITAVRSTSNTVTQNVPYGATLGVAVPVYLDSTDSKHKSTDANLSAVAAAAKGITMTPGVDGGYGLIAIKGSIILVGTTMAVGTTYYCGPTAGEIIPEDELGTGDNITRLGTAATTTQLDLDIKVTGITHP